MIYRKATPDDLPEIVAMYADDKLGKSREKFQTPLPKEYLDAFKNISEDKNHELIVVVNEANDVVGTLQLTFLQYLNRLGSLRAQIESVHIKKEQQGKGLGKAMFTWAINRAKEKNAVLVQLTSDKKRPEAIKFYENLGFIASHEGFKLQF
ncbi:GNAT family N-acetyltransferase [Algibacter pectinivorans]|uniref:Ribosomal protein S18 acetylase RimI n=1 Tax=Algibacter pectinivorans TaxID=870482 RepID=A0A1I1NNZ3_9FLAO|nr:GNAT family N-acetyltransferase [Algibacter pectinivorans]SFC99145.1 Ribosomal protein S18 acetylase RimI [Algibacter pectinivorans]